MLSTDESPGRLGPATSTDVLPNNLRKLVEEGRARLAVRPGYRPRMRAGDGTDRLGDALAALRDEERW